MLWDSTLLVYRKPKVALGLFKQLYIAKPCLPEGTQQAQQLAAYIGITPRQVLPLLYDTYSQTGHQR